MTVHPEQSDFPEGAVLEFSCEHRFASGFQLRASFASHQRVTAVVGPSGIGKSSVLAMIAGVLRPDCGRIAVGSEILFDSAVGICQPIEARRIGVVFQDLLLFPHLDVRGNLEFGRRRCGNKNMDWSHVVEMLELGDLLGRFPETLSGGQRQRVALGRALLQSPRLLLLDEPWSGLHAELKLRIIECVRRIIDDCRIPTVLVSHDPGDVAKMADTVIALDAIQASV
jgi:molybdate transport system ATP-binding protein